jgi:two-component system response regulator HydG
MQRLLIVDDDKDLCFLLNRFLTRKGYEVTVIYNGLQAVEYLEVNEPDLLISDLGLGDIDGITLLNKAKELHPNLPVIIITGFSDIKTSAIAMRQGAFDYVMKPLLPEQMLLSVQDALESRKRGVLSSSNYHFSSKEIKEYYFWGDNDSSKKLARLVHLVAPTHHNVIIYGEDGSGKRSVAHEIHKLSKRSHLPFVLVNAGGMQARNMAAVLFGAHTDIGEEKGLLDQANYGTMFISDPQLLSPDIQHRLLAAMRRRAWVRQGGSREIEMDIRFFVSSNTLLWEATRKGELHEELYHRLNDFTVSIAPLRERSNEIPDLVNHFLKMNNEALGINIKGTTPEALSVLKTYTWPDNIRELKNFIQKAALQCSGSYIGVECLPLEIADSRALVPED